MLYSYFRSSAAFRVRIGLNIKELKYKYIPIHLLKEGGQQNTPEYHKLNPMGEVPTLVDGDFVLAQSMAILLYLDETRTSPRLFPNAPQAKAQVIQFCENINAGIHPVQNLKVTQQLESRFNASLEQKNAWAAYWIDRGFKSLEKFLEKTAGTYCFGGQVTAADLYLIPQVFNAIRYQVNIAQFPKISGIYQRAMELEAFKLAAPNKQPDYTP